MGPEAPAGLPIFLTPPPFYRRLTAGFTRGFCRLPFFAPLPFFFFSRTFKPFQFDRDLPSCLWTYVGRCIGEISISKKKAPPRPLAESWTTLVDPTPVVLAGLLPSPPTLVKTGILNLQEFPSHCR